MFRITMVILLVMNLFTIGCAVTMPTAIIEQPKSVTTEDITAAAVVALQEHEYSVSTVNDRIGIVNTDWKDITSVGSKLLQASLTGTISHTRMKITITVNKSTNRINIKPLKQTQSGFGSWNSVSLSDGDYKNLNLIIARLCEIIGIPNSTVWIQP